MEGERVVLAKRVELDRSFDDLADVAVRPAVALGRKGGEELGVALIAGGRIEQGAQVTLGGVARARGLEVDAQSLEDLSRVAFDRLPLVGRGVPRADLL